MIEAKHPSAPPKLSEKQRAKLLKSAGYASVSVALTIILVKLVAWLLTGSLSLLSSLVDSMLDILTSLINLVALTYALQPPDKEHRYGHGKAEDIAALLQAAFIAGSAIFITVEAFGRFFRPEKMQNELFGIYTMLFSTVLTLLLVLFQRYVISRTNSSVIKADSLHYVTDLTVNILVMLLFITAQFYDTYWLDPTLAIAIACFLLFSAWSVAREAFDKLMDKEFSDEMRQQITDAIFTHPEVKGIHDLRTRSLGHKPFIQFHMELDPNIPLYEAHRISEEVEAHLVTIFPDAEIIIHQDPEGYEDIPEELEPIKAPLEPS